MATADETPYGNTETATLRVGIYFTQTQTQSMKAFAFSSVNSLFWFGNSRIPAVDRALPPSAAGAGFA